MLTAYFDDSGTHSKSDVVLWSGLCGNERQWALLSALWTEKLKSPSPAKDPLTHFHMAHCQDSRGEFAGWNRVATDFLVHELGGIILQSGVWGVACAVYRKDWDDLVSGNWREAWGDAEQYAAMNCFTNLSKMRLVAPNILGEEKIAVAFDDRPSSNEHVKSCYDIYRMSSAVGAEFASISFVSAAKCPPLQAADLVAWEHYQFAKDRMTDRTNTPRRKQFRRLLEKKRFQVKWVDRASVKRMLESASGNAEAVKLAAQAIRQFRGLTSAP